MLFQCFVKIQLLNRKAASPVGHQSLQGQPRKEAIFAGFGKNESHRTEQFHLFQAHDFSCWWRQIIASYEENGSLEYQVLETSWEGYLLEAHASRRPLRTKNVIQVVLKKILNKLPILSAAINGLGAGVTERAALCHFCHPGHEMACSGKTYVLFCRSNNQIKFIRPLWIPAQTPVNYFPKIVFHVKQCWGFVKHFKHVRSKKSPSQNTFLSQTASHQSEPRKSRILPDFWDQSRPSYGVCWEGCNFAVKWPRCRCFSKAALSTKTFPDTIILERSWIVLECCSAFKLLRQCYWCHVSDSWHKSWIRTCFTCVNIDLQMATSTLWRTVWMCCVRFFNSLNVCFSQSLMVNSRFYSVFSKLCPFSIILRTQKAHKHPGFRSGCPDTGWFFTVV